MIFISEPDKNTLVVKDTPVILAAAMIVLATVLFAIASQFDSEDRASMAIFFAFGVGVSFIAAVFLKVRRCTLSHDKRSVLVQDIGLLKRSQSKLALGSAPHAELVITKDSDDDSIFTAVLISQMDGKTQKISLDDTSSFKLPSARIVIAVNAWLGAEDTNPQG